MGMVKGVVRFGPPENLVLSLRDKLGIEIFVETGTYIGNTTRWAAGNFKKVITIELSQLHFDMAYRKLVPYENITRFHGSSPRVLSDLISGGLSKKCMFWLDAHWCGDGTAKDNSECPLLEELDVISKIGKLEGLIMIDDARLFIEPPPPPLCPKEWPNLKVIEDKLNSMSCISMVTEDVIFAVDTAKADILNGVLK